MSAGWTCADPACRATNAWSAAKCEACETPRTARSRRTEPDSPAGHADSACSWSSAAPCPMLASWYPAGTGRPGLCTWHSETRKNPRVDTEAEFVAWATRLREAGYCSGWTHSTAEALWIWLRGGRVPMLTACQHPHCPYGWPIEHRPPENRPAGRMTVTARVP